MHQSFFTYTFYFCACRYLIYNVGTVFKTGDYKLWRIPVTSWYAFCGVHSRLLLCVIYRPGAPVRELNICQRAYGWALMMDGQAGLPPWVAALPKSFPSLTVVTPSAAAAVTVTSRGPGLSLARLGPCGTLDRPDMWLCAWPPGQLLIVWVACPGAWPPPTL